MAVQSHRESVLITYVRARSVRVRRSKWLKSGSKKERGAEMEQNTIGYWISFLFIGGVIGWLAGIITRGRGFGLVGDIIVGIVGAMLGGWIGSVIGITASGFVGSFLLALLGAVVLVGLTRLVVRHV